MLKFTNKNTLHKMRWEKVNNKKRNTGTWTLTGWTAESLSWIEMNFEKKLQFCRETKKAEMKDILKIGKKKLILLLLAFICWWVDEIKFKRFNAK